MECRGEERDITVMCCCKGRDGCKRGKCLLYIVTSFERWAEGKRSGKFENILKSCVGSAVLGYGDKAVMFFLGREGVRN